MLTPYGKREIILVFVFTSVLIIIFVLLYRKTGISVFKYLNLLPIVLFLFTLYFFRDPPRKISYKGCEILAPCDGFVTHIDTVYEPYYFKEKVQRISIFMTMFDVHVQRSPIEGRVILTEHHPGMFINAQKEESIERNENNIIVVETKFGFPMLVKQIAGVFARRIVCGVEKGDHLDPGDKIGMVKFGSRGEIYLPMSVPIEVFVKEKEHVRAGLTALGRLKNCP